MILGMGQLFAISCVIVQCHVICRVVSVREPFPIYLSDVTELPQNKLLLYL